jgi:hypothetical protein
MANDWLAPTLGDTAIRYSLLIIAFTATMGGLMFWIAGRFIEADAARAAE